VLVSLQCEWTIQCGVGYSHVSLLFSRVETEEDYDEVAVYEGDQASDAAELSRLSGHNIPPTTVETAGRTALIQFTSDEDVAGVCSPLPLFSSCTLSLPKGSVCISRQLSASLLQRPCLCVPALSHALCADLGFEVSFDCVR
jgi:hypothetical protein